MLPVAGDAQALGIDAAVFRKVARAGRPTKPVDRPCKLEPSSALSNSGIDQLDGDRRACER